MHPSIHLMWVKKCSGCMFSTFSFEILDITMQQVLRAFIHHETEILLHNGYREQALLKHFNIYEGIFLFSNNISGMLWFWLIFSILVRITLTNVEYNTCFWLVVFYSNISLIDVHIYACMYTRLARWRNSMWRCFLLLWLRVLFQPRLWV